MTYEENLDNALKLVRATLIKKHKDYGSKNILKFKDIGVLVRLSDKLARMENLYGITDGSYQQKKASNESIEDTWLDVCGYGLIGLMLHTETFDCPTFEESKPKLGGSITGVDTSPKMDLFAKQAIIDKWMTEDKNLGFHKVVASAINPYKIDPEKTVRELTSVLSPWGSEFTERVISVVRYEGDKK